MSDQNMNRPREISYYLKNPFVIFYTFIRMASAVLILFNPVWGFFLTVFFDFWDGYFYEMIPRLVEMPRPTYQEYDKFQDWIGYIFMFVVGIKYGLFNILALLLVYRLVGQMIFLKIKKQAVFVVFTNFFEATFLWYVILPLMNVNPAYFWFYVLLIVYELREIFLHLYWPWELKRKGFPKYLCAYFGIRKQALW